jgi:hypothetical protein
MAGEWRVGECAVGGTIASNTNEAQEEQEKTYRQMPQPGGESAEQDEDAAQLRLGPDLQNCACLFSSEIVQVLEANKNVMTSSE